MRNYTYAEGVGMTEKYFTQTELNFKPAEATDKEFKEWEEKELNWWADKQLLIVAIAVVIQFSMLGFMFMVMAINETLF